MIQSMVNIQLEQIKKMFKEFPGRIRTLLKKFPPELKCFGFEVTDLDISYKKSQVQISSYQKPHTLTESEEEMCANFHEELNKHPEKIMEQMAGNGALSKGLNALKDVKDPAKDPSSIFGNARKDEL